MKFYTLLICFLMIPCVQAQFVRPGHRQTVQCRAELMDNYGHLIQTYFGTGVIKGGFGHYPQQLECEAYWSCFEALEARKYVGHCIVKQN